MNLKSFAIAFACGSLFFSGSAQSAVAETKPVKKVAPKCVKYKSPEAVFEVYKKALINENWEQIYRCATERSIDLAFCQMLSTIGFFGPDSPLSKPLIQCLEKHKVKWKEIFKQEESTKSSNDKKGKEGNDKKESTDEDYVRVLNKLTANVKNKPAMMAELLKHANHAMDKISKAIATEKQRKEYQEDVKKERQALKTFKLIDVKITGNRATGKTTMAGQKESDIIQFQKVNGSWLIDNDPR